MTVRMYLITLLFLVTLGLMSCKDTKKETDKIEIAKAFYGTRNSGDYSSIPSLLADSIITKELDYTMAYSQTDYIAFMKWDAVFEPEYNFTEMKEENGTVRAQVSKMDRRIRFLHEQPTIYQEVIRFKEDKISHLEIEDYIFFDDTVFSKNRAKLVHWIEENHPELNGFLHDQTEQGALNYLKAIALYEDNN